jgi:outer membrane protein assembly factor BamB
MRQTTATIVAVLLSAAVAIGDGWPDWRGPMQDRHYAGPPLPTSFDPESGRNVLWKNDEAGGISTPVIMGGRLFTLVRHKPGTQEEAEKVLCLDAASGKKLWENVFNVYLSDVPAERVGWSAVVADPASGMVFAHGVCGVFTAIDAKTGATRWQRSLHEEFGFLSTYGGRTNVPLVFEDLVIASAVVTGWGDTARPAHRFLGMDKATGEVRWRRSSSGRATAASGTSSRGRARPSGTSSSPAAGSTSLRWWMAGTCSSPRRRRTSTTRRWARSPGSRGPARATSRRPASSGSGRA